MDRGAWWAAVHEVAKSWTRLSEFTLTFHFHALEKEMATHSSVLAWRIPGMGEPGVTCSFLFSSQFQVFLHFWFQQFVSLLGFLWTKYFLMFIELLESVNLCLLPYLQSFGLWFLWIIVLPRYFFFPPVILGLQLHTCCQFFCAFEALLTFFSSILLLSVSD